MAAIDAGTAPRRATPASTRSRGARLSGGHLVMILAGLLALVANLAVLRAGEETVEVWSLAADLPVGAIVTAADLELVTVPASTPTAGLILGAQPVGQVLVNRVERADLLRANDLASPLAAEAGLRQMSLPIAQDRAAGGLIRVDDRIDVIQVRDGRAVFLLAGVRVIQTGRATSGLGASSAASLVLEVDAAQALCLAEALAGGQLDVVRSTGQDPVRATGCLATPSTEGARR